MKESLEKTKPLWLELEYLLKKNNLLPSDYDTEKHNLYFTFDENMIVVEDRETESFQQMLSDLLNKK